MPVAGVVEAEPGGLNVDQPDVVTLCRHAGTDEGQINKAVCSPFKCTIYSYFVPARMERRRLATQLPDTPTPKRTKAPSVEHYQQLVLPRHLDIVTACKSANYDALQAIINDIAAKCNRTNALSYAKRAFRASYDWDEERNRRSGPLHWALESGSLTFVTRLLTEFAFDPMREDSRSYPFAVAIQIKSPMLVQLMLDYGATVTPNCLQLAMQRVEIRKVPLDLFPSLDILQSGTDGRLLVLHADEKARFFASWQSCSDVPLVDHERFFHRFPPNIRSCPALIFRLLLAHAEKYNKDFHNQVASPQLMKSAMLTMFDDVTVVRLLLEKGSDPLANWTAPPDCAVHFACALPNLEYLRLFTAKDVVVQHCKTDYRALHRALMHRNHIAIEFLLNTVKVDPNLVNEKRTSAVHIAARKDDVISLNLLNVASANLNLQDIDQNTPLHLAVLEDSAEAIVWLLKNGADGSIKNAVGKTASDIAPAHLKAHFGQASLDLKIAHLSSPLGQQSSVISATCLITGGEDFNKSVQLGTGFFLRWKDTLVFLTNAHVVAPREVEKSGVKSMEDWPKFWLRYKHQTVQHYCPFLPTDIIKGPNVDLACVPLSNLKLWTPSTAKPPFLQLLDDWGALTVGHTLHVLGYPTTYRNDALYSSCCIGGVENNSLVLTGGGINPGNSGGPLITITSSREVRVVGVIVAGQLPWVGITHAIPFLFVANWLNTLTLAT